MSGLFKGIKKSKPENETMQSPPDRRTVMVTGATSGIGRAVAKRFAADSANVIALARNRSALEEVEQEVTAAGGTPLPLMVDVTVEDELRRAVDQGLRRFG